MASIVKRPNGHRWIQFLDGNRRRQTLRLGKVSQRAAEAIKVKVEALAEARFSGRGLDDETARWVGKLGQTLADKLAAVGLLARRDAVTLAAFLDGYIAKRIDVKPSTATVYGHTRRNLIDHFGAGKVLRDITEADADEFRLYLIGQQLADNTVRRRCGIAKQFLRAAVKGRLIPSNPFSELKGSVRGNEDRYYFVTQAEAAKVLDACPDAQWRLLFALSRYGGLRCPSEHVGLRWADIDWERGRMLVTSPKTARHEGKETRWTPIFPELRPYLDAVWNEAPEGAEFVITIRRADTANLRTRMRKIIRRAGLTPWPKLFQNLRSSRQTELASRFPIHVVCEWIGNSEIVAKEHYLQMTDDHFAMALLPPPPPPEEAKQNPKQKAKQNTLAGDATALHGFGSDAENAEICRAVQPCDTLRNLIQSEQLGGTGLEPVTSTV